MSQLIIYGHIISQPVGTVLAFCKLSNIPHQFVNVDFMKGEHLTEDFAKINPYQQIPSIMHNEYNLWESGAIVVYLADAFDIDNQWFPKDFKERGRINAYFHWHHQGVREVIIDYLRAKIAGPKFMGCEPMSEEEEKEFKDRIEIVIGNVENMLKDTQFIARTREASIADIHAYAEFASMRLLDLDLSKFTTFNNWLRNIGNIPEVKDIDEQAQVVVNQIFRS